MSCQAERIREIAPGIFRIVVQLPIPEVGSMNSKCSTGYLGHEAFCAFSDFMGFLELDDG
jgi:hypothetical protein